MTRAPPIHIRFEEYANDWITETARRNRMSKPDLIREIVAEKMEALGVQPPKVKIEYAAKRTAPTRNIQASDIIKMSKGKV